MKVDVDIDACKQGEREALGELYKAYHGRLMSVCRHYVTDESTAEDILHDAFIIIFTSIGMLKDNAKLEGWMVTIVRNLALRHLHSMAKDDIPLSGLEIELSGDDSDEGKAVDLELLLSAIESLPEGGREVFKLSVLEGLSHQEIGSLLGINAHSSSSQLFRAKKTLRAMLVNYWMLLLLPVLIPIYIYFVARDRHADSPDDKSTEANAQQKQAGAVRKAGVMPKTGQPEDSIPSMVCRHHDRVLAETTVPVEKIDLEERTDSADSGQQIVSFQVDSLRRHLVTGVSVEDSVSRVPYISVERMTALHEDAKVKMVQRKKYPWLFNFGYSSNAGADGPMSNLNYLSLIDYANGGATAKLYTWADLESYYVRNNALMDSVERARMSLMLLERPTDDSSPLDEVARHERPKTFALSVSKQLNGRWTLGTGVTYTRLKSEFESEYHKARLVKTQKIDYVGIPLRLTYRIWGRGRFNAYTTGGVTFELPVHSSLSKKYTVTSDSAYTLRGDIKARYQWSVNWGLGVQYRLFKPFSLYLEPNMFYYFGNGSSLETYRTEHPFVITVPFGVRLTW